MLETRTSLLTGSLVKDGRRHSHMIINSPTWEITTSVGTPMEPLNPRSGALPLIQKFVIKTAQFHYVPLWRLLTFPWTMIKTLTKTTAPHTPFWKRKTFLPPSLYVLLSWWRLGPQMETVQRSLSSLMTMEKSGTGLRFMLQGITHNSHFNLRILQNFQSRAKSSTPSSGPGFAYPKTRTLPS